MKIRYHVCTLLRNVFIKQPVDLKITQRDSSHNGRRCGVYGNIPVKCSVRFSITQGFFFFKIAFRIIAEYEIVSSCDLIKKKKTSQI